MVDQSSSLAATPDAPRRSLVDAMPAVSQPYLRLMRADRPIGTWLLLIPCWWGLSLAALAGGAMNKDLWTYLFFGGLFAIGAFVMRGAGCVYNDIVDRDIDAKVSRTASRPLPSGQVTLQQAWLFLIGLCLVGLLVLIQFNRATIITGLLALGLVAAYPFMKRITWWPQAWLGLTFNWGILVGWMAVTGELNWAAVNLYIAGIFWTLGYDTIYAHQDREDDALIGVKSTARRLAGHTREWLLAFYTGMIFFVALAGLLARLGPWFYVALTFPAVHLIWQTWTLDQNRPATCLALFKANRETGLMILLALWFGQF